MDLPDLPDEDVWVLSVTWIDARHRLHALFRTAIKNTGKVEDRDNKEFNLIKLCDEDPRKFVDVVFFDEVIDIDDDMLLYIQTLAEDMARKLKTSHGLHRLLKRRGMNV